MKKKRNAKGNFFGLLAAMVLVSAGGLFMTTDGFLLGDYGSNTKAQLTPFIGNPYLTNWRKSGPGGGGFTMDIRVAPKSFFGLTNESRVYLAEDMHGVFRSKKMNWKTGEVSRWEHLWFPVQGVAEEIPTKFVTSLAFAQSNTTENSNLVVATRDGIFLFNESTKKWTKPASLPSRKDLEKQGFEIDESDGSFPWTGIIREVEGSSLNLLSGIGDARESYKIGKRRYGLSALYRSRDGGKNWDIIKLNSEDKNEVVFDIRYVTKGDKVSAFVITDKAVYYSDTIFTEQNPNFSVISKNLPINTSASNLPTVEVRSVEVLESATSSKIGIMVALHSEVLGNGGVYETVVNDLNDFKSGESFEWRRMAADTDRTFRYIGKLQKTRESNLENYKVYLAKFNVPYLAVKNTTLSKWVAIVSNESDNGDRAYEESWDRSAFGSFEVVPKDLINAKEPFVYGAWTYGPIVSPGHSGEVQMHRKFYQMFSYLHHEYQNTKFYVNRGFDEGSFLGAIPELKFDQSGIVVLAAPDNGIMVSHDFARTWSASHPRERSGWVEDYGTPLITGYQARFHPKNSKCIFVSAGPNRFGHGIENVGEVVVNTKSGFGTSSSWSIFAGGRNNVLNLPNAEVHTMVFDPRESESSNAILWLGVRGHGLYVGEITTNCTLKEGTQFKKVEHSLLSEKIALSPGQHHYYSSLLFDPYNKDELYVARTSPTGGVFKITLSADTKRGSRLGIEKSEFINKVDEIIRGVVDQNGLRRCPLDENSNDRAAVQVNSISISKDYLFAAVGYGEYEDLTPENKRCSPKIEGGPVNYYGGLIRMNKSGFASSNLPDYSNNWIIGGPENKGNTPGKLFNVGAVAVNPVKTKEVVAITTGSVFPKTRVKDGIQAGEEDAKISGLYTSDDGGQSFVFTPWAISFPNALSLKFSPNGKMLYVPTRGNGIWVWQDPRL